MNPSDFPILTKIRYIDPSETRRGFEALSNGQAPHWEVSSHDLESEDEHLPELEMLRARTFEQALIARKSLLEPEPELSPYNTNYGDPDGSED